MFTCVICQFNAELDDVALSGPSGRCVCLRCYLRETGNGLAMSKSLRRDLAACVNGISASAE